ncbi:MAG: SprT family zinc-dependent metalloprotease [Candidatus Nitrosopolaris sp.]
MKTSEIIVEANKVLVRTPFHKPVSEIHEIVKKKANWILKKQLEYKRLNPQITKATFQHGSTLPYLGKNYPLKIINNHVGSEKIELVKGEFLIFTNGSKHSKKKIKLLYERWLSDATQYFLDKKIKKYSKELRVEPKGIILKRLKDRWGSATKDGVINLSLNLLKAPTDIIDYMILHELCHLKIKEHSHRFWDLVHKFMPKYEDKIDWLKVNGNSLIST